MSSSPKDESLDSISHTLAQVMRLSGSRSMFARQAAAAGVVLTQPAYVLLRILIDEGPQSMGALARSAHMDVGMATRQVSSLVDAKLATREPDPADPGDAHRSHQDRATSRRLSTGDPAPPFASRPVGLDGSRTRRVRPATDPVLRRLCGHPDRRLSPQPSRKAAMQARRASSSPGSAIGGNWTPSASPP